MKTDDAVVWTSNGAWLITIDGSGRQWDAELGKVDRERLEVWCHELGIPFAIVHRRRPPDAGFTGGGAPAGQRPKSSASAP